MLGQDTWSNLVDLADKLEHGVVGQFAERKFALRHISWISLAENSVAVTRHDTATVESVPEVFGDVRVAEIIADCLLHLGEPVQDLLVGQPVERTSQTVETGSKRQHGGAQSATNQVSRVRADITTLVVGVDGQVQAHQLNEVGVAAVAKLVGQIVTIILIFLNWSNLSVLVCVAVDLGCDGRKLSNQVHRVLEGVCPVFLLVDALGVGFGELGGVLERSDGDGELSHRVHVVGAAVDELFDELGKVGASSPVSREVSDLLFAGDLAGEEQPEKTFWKGFLSTRSLGEDFLAFWNGLPPESDTLLRVKDGSFPNKGLDASGTTVDLI